MSQLARLRRPRRAPRERGQSIVEFGIVVVIFFFLIMGIVDFGMLLNSWVAVSSAAREAARQAAVGTQPDSIRSLVQLTPLPGVDRTQGPVRVDIYLRGTLVSGNSWPVQPNEPKPGDLVRVVVAADYFSVVTPVVRAAFGCPGTQANCFVPLASETTVRFEGVHIQ